MSIMINGMLVVSLTAMLAVADEPIAAFAATSSCWTPPDLVLSEKNPNWKCSDQVTNEVAKQLELLRQQQQEQFNNLQEEQRKQEWYRQNEEFKRQQEDARQRSEDEFNDRRNSLNRLNQDY